MRAADITAVVLCGGSASRFGTVDKTLLPLAGRPLVAHAIEALRPQVGPVIISCGRDPRPYEGLAARTVTDQRPQQGPLGGIVSAVPLVETEWMLVHPGDMPVPSSDLVARLTRGAERAGVAVPLVGDYRQHLVMLLSRAAARELCAFYERGGRAARQWLDERGVASVDMTDVAETFLNVNDATDLATAERRLRRRG